MKLLCPEDAEGTSREAGLEKPLKSLQVQTYVFSRKQQVMSCQALELPESTHGHPELGTLSLEELRVSRSTEWGQVQVCLNETLGMPSLKNNQGNVTAV